MPFRVVMYILTGSAVQLAAGDTSYARPRPKATSPSVSETCAVNILLNFMYVWTPVIVHEPIRTSLQSCEQNCGLTAAGSIRGPHTTVYETPSIHAQQAQSRHRSIYSGRATYFTDDATVCTHPHTQQYGE